MGDRPVVVAKPPVADPDARLSVRCEHAIFTSIRSAAGQGYRLIAASAGVCADEKAEITRRSPSHRSLCETNSDPVALSSYLLGSGRHCITYCCHAGCEHTARGGERVYSHMVLLDRVDYRLFNSDPVRVHAALGQVVTRTGPLLKPPPWLEPISLEIPPSAIPPVECAKSTDLPGREHSPTSPKSPRSCGLKPARSFLVRKTLTRDRTTARAQACGSLESMCPLEPTCKPFSTSDWIPATAAELLAGRRLILVGAPHPLWLLEWALLWLPRDVRESVDVSYGLKFSPARQMQLVLLPQAGGQLRRLIAGRDVTLRHVDAAPPPLVPDFERWFRLLHRWWHEGRLAELVRLTSNVCADALAGASAHP